MKCPVCGKGSLKAKKVDVEKYGVSVGRFEAEVCASCGEQIFSSEEAEKIEKKLKTLGLWALPQESRVYKLGGNLVISIRKKIAQALGLTKDSRVFLVPQPSRKRLVIEVS